MPSCPFQNTLIELHKSPLRSSVLFSAAVGLYQMTKWEKKAFFILSYVSLLLQSRNQGLVFFSVFFVFGAGVLIDTHEGL